MHSRNVVMVDDSFVVVSIVVEVLMTLVSELSLVTVVVIVVRFEVDNVAPINDVFQR